MHVLEGIAGAAAGKCLPVPPAGLTVGKRPENDLQLPDEFVSRSHARFYEQEGNLWVTDLGSTNGTFVNEVQVQSVRLRAGDRIQIGGSLLRYRDRPVALFQRDSLGAAGGPQPTVIRTVVRRAPEPPPAPAVSAAGVASASEALAELSRLRPGSLTPEQALGRILEIVFTFLPVDRGCVVFVGEDGEFATAAVRYRDPARAREDMPLSRTLLARAVETRSALLIPDALSDATLAQAASIVASRLRCVAYLPLAFGDEVIGAICLDTHVPGGLREEHLEELVGFANQAALVAWQVRMEERIRSELEVRGRLQRFLSRSVAEQFLREGREPELGGEERDITVLFADLRGYTPLAERISPTEAVSLLNMMFERLVAPILALGGVVDKYIGDCVMAFFGAPTGDSEHCRSAVRAALSMQEEMRTVTAQLAAKYDGLAIGISINTGSAVVGIIGSELKMDYTAIGDVVNVAARVEDLAGPDQILVTEAVAREVASEVQLEPFTTVALRGRAQPTAVFAVRGVKLDPAAGAAVSAGG